jgi:multidrug efflux pump subunit AcrA (membrane-fusion protein)
MEGGGESATSVTCRVPDRVVVFDGLTMSMAIPAGSAKGVLVVPVTAVRGLLARGKVWVVGPEGAPKPRNVELGITDGKQIEVLSGLAEGDQVLRYVPGSSPQDGMEGDMMEGEVMYG